MISLLNRIAVSLMNSIGMLLEKGPEISPKFEWIDQITKAIDAVLWPLLIVIGSAGTIYAIVIGVNMAKADSTEKREEAKKRLINVLLGIAITVGLILFFRLLTATILPAVLKPEETGNSENTARFLLNMFKLK